MLHFVQKMCVILRFLRGKGDYFSLTSGNYSFIIANKDTC